MFSLEELKYDISTCMRCSNCKWIDHVYIRGYEFAQICPSLQRYLFDAYSCQGRVYIAEALLNGKLKHSPKLLEIIYKCTLCGACDVMCKRCMDMEPLLILEALRVKCVKEWNSPLSEHKAIAENIEKTGNIYAEPEKKRLDWIPENFEPPKKSSNLFFVGCALSYRQREIAEATFKILRKAGIDFTVTPEEKCCGNILYSTGQLDQAVKTMKYNMELFHRLGVEQVITGCAACYKTLKVDYPKLLNKSTEDLGFKVVHITELLEQLVKEGRLEFRELETRVTYHDPCQLGRLSEPWIHWEGKREKFGILNPPKRFRRGTYGIYDAPRNILKNIPGLKLVEMVRRKENAWCCGAGGGVREAFKDFALWTAEERIKESKAIGAEAIITCCPFCKENLMDVVKKKEEKLEVYDLTEIVVKVMEV